MLTRQKTYANTTYSSDELNYARMHLDHVNGTLCFALSWSGAQHHLTQEQRDEIGPMEIAVDDWIVNGARPLDGFVDRWWRAGGWVGGTRPQ